MFGGKKGGKDSRPGRILSQLKTISQGPELAPKEKGKPEESKRLAVLGGKRCEEGHPARGTLLTKRGGPRPRIADGGKGVGFEEERKAGKKKGRGTSNKGGGGRGGVKEGTLIRPKSLTLSHRKERLPLLPAKIRGKSKESRKSGPRDQKGERTTDVYTFEIKKLIVLRGDSDL